MNTSRLSPTSQGYELFQSNMPTVLAPISNYIPHRELMRISPLAVPVMLEIGREAVHGEASDDLLAEAAEELVKEAMS
jgi:ATP-dependent Lhr-like helicase